MKVNQFTMQSPDYFNVFGLGDSAALPTAKTGAAVRKQAPVIVENILRLMDSKDILPESKGYNGYSSCPLVKGYGNKLMSDPLLSTFVDTTKEQYSMWLLKKYGLPILYWNFMLRGKA
jgi:sulfide:quinone oxidoreductase